MGTEGFLPITKAVPELSIKVSTAVGGTHCISNMFNLILAIFAIAAVVGKAVNPLEPGKTRDFMEDIVRHIKGGRLNQLTFYDAIAITDGDLECTEKKRCFALAALNIWNTKLLNAHTHRHRAINKGTTDRSRHWTMRKTGLFESLVCKGNANPVGLKYLFSKASKDYKFPDGKCAVDYLTACGQQNLLPKA